MSGKHRHSPAPRTFAPWFLTASAPTPFAALGGTVHAFPFANQLPFNADAAGTFTGATTWPAGLPMGTEIYFQFIVQDLSVPDGLTLSNGLKATTMKVSSRARPV